MSHTEPNLPTFEAIIFDAEGVVIDTESLWDVAQQTLLERRGLRYDRDRVKHLIAGKSALDGIVIFQREFKIAGDPKDLAAERSEIMRRLIADRLHFIPGFREFFASASVLYKSCIATSMPDDLLILADRRLHLSSLFSGRIFSISDVGNRSKPDPDLFLFAARKLSVAPSACLVIEDSPNGIEAARRAGIFCIGLATTFPREALQAANLIASSYEDIARLLHMTSAPTALAAEPV